MSNYDSDEEYTGGFYEYEGGSEDEYTGLETNELEFGASVFDYERVGGPSDALGTSIEGDDILKKYNKIISGKDFVNIINAICVKFSNLDNNPEISTLFNKVLNEIVPKIELTPHVQYKNPYGYVFGFIVYRAGENEIKVFNKLCNNLDFINSILKEYDIELDKITIIRYTRLWQSKFWIK